MVKRVGSIKDFLRDTCFNVTDTSHSGEPAGLH